MTTTVAITPASTMQNFGPWAITGASAHAALADASDATFVDGQTFEQLHHSLTNPTIPAGARVVAVQPRFRAAINTAFDTDPTPFRSRLMTGDYTGTIYFTDLVSVASTGIHDLSGAARAKSSTGADWTTTELDGLELNLYSMADPTESVRLYRAYVDVTYAVIPVVTVNLPTSPSGTSFPTVGWSTVFDAAYPTQERYHVRVFTAAQYGIGGFDPATSPATWDSTETLGTATSVVVGTALLNGTTYRAYVRTAAGVNGSPHWSAWANRQWTVAITPPGVPTVSATADNANRRIAIALNDTAGATTATFRVERSLDNGATWDVLRGAAAATPGTGVTVYDPEAPNGHLMRYRAQAVTAAGIASAFSSASSAVAWEAEVWRLVPITAPLEAIDVVLYSPGIPTIKRRRPQGVFDVLGRADPVIVSDTRKLGAGDVAFVTLDDAEGLELAAVLDHPGTLLLHGRAGTRWGSRYLIVGDHDEAFIAGLDLEGARIERVAWREVAAPADGAP